MKYFFIFWVMIIAIGCNTVKQSQLQPRANTISSLKLIGQYNMPHNLLFKNTTIGGLSGIDYDASNNIFYLISDDRSAINAARYYTAKIHLSINTIDSVQFLDVYFLKDSSGNYYPNNKQNPSATPDPEGIRYNPITKQLIWTSEGERIVNKKDTILSNPSITTITKNGEWVFSFSLPQNLQMNAAETGPRQNGVLEGITFANQYKKLIVNVEEPLFQDGPRASLQPNKAFVRFYVFNTRTKQNTAQYAYELDSIAHPSKPVEAFKVNGIPDILSINKNELLVLERSFSTGILPCTIKIFKTDLSTGSNIRNNLSLQNNTHFTPVTKSLLLNMDDLGIYVDNVEGITFGPTLPNGHKTLILVADNNFSPVEKTQFFIFEVMP